MKKIIKKTTRFIAVALMLLMFNSCENLLDDASSPDHFTPAQEFYKNADELDLAIIGCYNGLQDPTNNEFFLTEIRSDNSKTTIGSSYESVQLIYRLDGFLPQSSNPYIERYWQDTYANIQNINLALEHIDVVEDEDLRNHFTGELLFLRAHHYFNLMRLFGPIPIYLESTKISDLTEYFSKTRVSLDVIYGILKDDLAFASEHMYTTPYNDEIGRVTQWAAKALMGKILLTQGDYLEAKIYLQDVYLNSGISLEPNYADVFSNEHSNEVLFSVRYAANSGNIGSPFANYFAPIKSDNIVVNGDGKGWNYPTDDLIEAFTAENDPRGIGVSINTEFTNAIGSVVNQYEGGAYCLKFISQPDLVNDAENDFPVIRFADIILMMAEVTNELEGPGVGLPYLNEVRIRANIDPIVSITTREAFKDALLHERRLEFAFENIRWFDLVRLERAQDIMTAHFGNNATDAEYLDSANSLGKAQVQTILPLGFDRLLLPLPEKEIKANPNLTQNNYN